MRIVAGKWRGRRLASPRGRQTRPTSDRVREAVFDVLASRFPECLAGNVLDAFAGSGAMGLEALSRGAGLAVFIENDRDAITALRRNKESLRAEEAMIVRGDAFRLLGGGLPVSGPFSLLLLDPPYRIEPAQVAKVLSDALRIGLLGDGSVVVYEHSASVAPVWPPPLEEVVRKVYGDTAATFAVVGRGG
ncbi:MAG: 16S rRNA (guanine(966)-N(2))-methyltransferase RsmD [Coriobacteriia bacterium]